MNNSFSPFTFHGRLGRGRFLGYALLMGVIGNVAIFVGLFAFVFLTDTYIDERDVTPLAGALYNYATALLGLSYSVRRLHDLGHSGKWMIALLLPWGVILPYPLVLLVSVLVLFVFAVAPGTDGPNRYGEGR